MDAHGGTLAAVTEPLRCYRHPDRETYVSCTECGRGICPDCMTFGPVGIRCPDHASTGGRGAGAEAGSPAGEQVAAAGLRGPFVTQALIAINVGIYILQLAMGAGFKREQRLDLGARRPRLEGASTLSAGSSASPRGSGGG